MMVYVESCNLTNIHISASQCSKQSRSFFSVYDFVRGAVKVGCCVRCFSQFESLIDEVVRKQEPEDDNSLK